MTILQFIQSRLQISTNILTLGKKKWLMLTAPAINHQPLSKN